MAITLGSLIRIQMVQLWMAQTCINDWDYQVDGSAFLVTPAQIAEAWWNHVKTTYRGLVQSTTSNVFRSVRILELNNPTGDYGEYAVPIGEQAGTRIVSPAQNNMPPFAAVAVRLTVGSRLTRPGQKRFIGTTEGDQSDGVLGSSLVTPVNTHMAVMTAPMILGAPAATIVLNPIVTGLVSPGNYGRHQPIEGWVTNPNVSTQNSRKFGRGI